MFGWLTLSDPRPWAYIRFGWTALLWTLGLFWYYISVLDHDDYGTFELKGHCAASAPNGIYAFRVSLSCHRTWPANSLRTPFTDERKTFYVRH